MGPVLAKQGRALWDPFHDTARAMRQTTIQLTGMKAVLALVALFGIVGFQWVSADKSLPTEGRTVLENWIQLEFQRDILDDSGSGLEERGEALLGATEIRIASLSAHGSPDDLVVRVELRPDPAIPPGTDMTRYYAIEHSVLTGWGTPNHASALSYYLRFF